MPSALFGRLVISWESPGLRRPTPFPGRSSAGTATVPPSPGSSSPERTGARPSPVLLVCSSRSPSPSPAWDATARCSGRVGLPIYICGQIAQQGEREPPTERARAGTEVRPAKQGGSRCHRSGQRKIRRQARRARRGGPSRRKRPRAGSSRGWGRPSAAVALTSRRAERALAFIDRDGERPQSASADALAQGESYQALLIVKGPASRLCWRSRSFPSSSHASSDGRRPDNCRVLAERRHAPLWQAQRVARPPQQGRRPRLQLE